MGRSLRSSRADDLLKVVDSRVDARHRGRDHRLIKGDCVEVLAQLPEASVDLIFADPPYLLSNGGTTCASGRRVSVDKGAWDSSGGLATDHDWNRRWLEACRRVLKPSGTIWVSGTQHVIFSIGFAMQQLGYHFLNTITWFKPNASPNLACRFFTHSTEIVLWASPARCKPLAHTFHYREMKAENGGKQMRDLWQLPEPDGTQVIWSLPTPAKSEKTRPSSDAKAALAARPDRARRLEPGRSGARSIQRLGHHRRGRAGHRASLPRDRSRRPLSRPHAEAPHRRVTEDASAMKPKPVWLFRVFDAFNVRGNGWVLLPGVLRDDPEVAVGDSVELRGGKAPPRPAIVKGVGVFAPSGGEGEARMPLLVELEPTDRPLIIGAEVWTVPKS